MPSVANILERLPSLYRPEPGFDKDDLLLKLVSAVGQALDEVSEASSEVLQSHWYAYADSAVYSPWVARTRALAGAGPLSANDALIDQFPYLRDLPRIAALVDLRPWREPLRDRERVEAFRERVRRIVRLHRDGLGTVRALRTMTQAALPEVSPDAAKGLRERCFTVEEFSAGGDTEQAVSQPGLPPDMVGPLMRWQLQSQSLEPVSPLVVIQGVTPDPGHVDPTSQPIIERFDPAAGTGVGIHYQGDLAPDQALALVPGYQSWLGTSNGLELCTHAPAGVERANPTAPGPWTTVTGGPTDAVTDIAQTADHCLWAAVNGPGGGSLWRTDGTTWQPVLQGLPQVNCLLARGGELVVGLATGLARLEIQPLGTFTLEQNPSATGDPAVHALAVDAAGTLWVATAQGFDDTLTEGRISIQAIPPTTKVEFKSIRVLKL